MHGFINVREEEKEERMERKKRGAHGKERCFLCARRKVVSKLSSQRLNELLYFLQQFFLEKNEVAIPIELLQKQSLWKLR